MENSHRRSSKRTLLGNYLLKKYENALSLKKEERGPGEQTKLITNKDLIQGIAGSLFDATWERFKSFKENDAITIDEDFEQFLLNAESASTDSFWKDENFRQEYEQSVLSSEEDHSTTPSSVKSNKRYNGDAGEHFIDMLIDRLILSLLPDELPEREQFSQRVSEPGRRKSQTISVRIMNKNLRYLTSKLGSVFELQDVLIRLLTWRNPSGTLLSLIAFTFICFDPMLLIILPVLYLMFGLMVPGYLHRHPLHRSIYLSKRSYGKSLVNTIASGGRTTSLQPHDSFREVEYSELDLEELRKANTIKQSMEFIVNLRDLQNLMTNIVRVTEGVEKFVYGSAGFKDEQHSTVLFLSQFLVLIALWIISPLINWPFMASVSAWTVMIIIHPKVRPAVVGVLKKEQLDKGKEALERTERFDILLDEPVESSLVEVFELHRKGITDDDWFHYLYSTQVFDGTDQYRKSQKVPPGVKNLEDLYPPPTWTFDPNSEWNVDTDPSGWAKSRHIFDLETQDEFLVDDQFKRRRLIRKVIRYANPARKPPYR